MCVVCHVCDRVVTGIASTAAAAAAADGAVILILMSAASQLPWRETCLCCSVGVSCFYRRQKIAQTIAVLHDTALCVYAME